MNAGKAMAQSSHASNAFVNCLPKGSTYPIHVKAVEWQKETTQGFGTVLVLGATENDINRISDWYSIRGVAENENCIEELPCVFEKIVDPTYPYIVNSEIAELIGKEHHTGESPIPLESGDCLCLRNEVTCAYLFADKNNEQIQELLKDLELHP
jgi:hypothetical protein